MNAPGLVWLCVCSISTLPPNTRSLSFCPHTYMCLLISFAAAGANCTCSAPSTCIARINLLFFNKSSNFQTWKQLHRKRQRWFLFFLDWDSVINNISDYRVNWFLANAKCWSINNDRTHERVKSQHSLAVHWLWSGTVTAQTPLRFHTLLQMFWCFLISEAVLCLWTEDTQISVMEAELEETSLPSSVVSLSGSILTTGEVRWTVRVRTGCFVFVTITAASSARWLTVYIPAAVVC